MHLREQTLPAEPKESDKVLRRQRRAAGSPRGRLEAAAAAPVEAITTHVLGDPLISARPPLRLTRTGSIKLVGGENHRWHGRNARRLGHDQPEAGSAGRIHHLEHVTGLERHLALRNQHGSKFRRGNILN